MADAPSVLAIAGTIASQSALLGGLLYYFGWVHAMATLAYFGLDTSLVGYSFPDYLLRSIGVAFLPFIQVAFAALVLLGMHRFVVQRALETPAGSRAQRVVQRIVTVGHIVAVALAALVIIGVLVPNQIGRPLGQALPLLLIGSVALLGYALYLRSTHPKALATTQPSHSRAQAIVLLTLGLLGLAGTGVEVAEIAQPGNKYRYQYSGIRLLARSTDKYLLLPVDWQRGRDRVFVIPDDDSIRIDIAARYTD